MTYSQKPTRKQHYVPCSYLKFFSHTGCWKDGRKTKVFFTDGNISKCVQVRDLAVNAYTYSKEFPEFDSIFERMEKAYPAIAQKIIGGETTVNRFEFYCLLLMMMDLHLRSIAYEKRTATERMNLYLSMASNFLESIFAETKNDGISEKVNFNKLEKHWRLQGVTVESEDKFVTSDHPSKIFSDPKNKRVILIYLPIHPSHAVVAYDHRYMFVNSAAPIKDDVLGFLNGAQVHGSIRHIFSDHDLLSQEDRDADKLRKLLKKPKPTRYVDDSVWHPDFFLANDDFFRKISFLTRRNKPNKVLVDAVRVALKSAI